MLNDSHANLGITRLTIKMLSSNILRRGMEEIKPILGLGVIEAGRPTLWPESRELSPAGRIERLGYRDDFGLLRPT